MAQKTDAELTTDANVIGNETTANANTASRVGSHFEDIIDSKLNNENGYLVLRQFTTAGGTTAYTGTTSPAITAYATGQLFQAKINATSTGSSTLDLNSLGAKKVFTSPTVQAGSGDLLIDKIYLLAYDAALDSAVGGFLIIGFSSGSVSDTAYDATSWNGVTDVAPSKNAVRDELELKAYLASPTFTGTPAAPTAAVGTSTTQIATTEFVQGEVGFTTVSVTGAVSLDSTAFGKMHVCTGTTVNYTIDLPTAVGNAGKSIAFKGSSALTKNVTIDGTSGQTIDGDATREFNANGLLVLLSDGTNWNLVAEVGSWVNYTPVWTGFSADPTVVSSKYFRQGKACRIKIRTSANGTSNATTKTVTFPFNASAVTDFALIAMVANNGAVTATPGLLITRANNNIVDLYRDTSTAAWTASGGCRMNIDCTYEAE